MTATCGASFVLARVATISLFNWRVAQVDRDIAASPWAHRFRLRLTHAVRFPRFQE
jgi:hypothetical protein